MTTSATPCVAALDVGQRRIGVALGRLDTGLASPHSTVENNENFISTLQQFIKNEEVGTLVVGLPRGMDGQETAQTQTVRDFVADLQKSLDIPIHWQDEAATSLQAEAELEARGKGYNREEVDAYAAAIILQDYLNEHRELRG